MASIPPAEDHSLFKFASSSTLRSDSNVPKDGLGTTGKAALSKFASFNTLRDGLDKVVSSTAEEKQDLPKAESPAPPTVPQVLTVPEGGPQAWITIAGAWLVLFATFGYLYSFGVYEDFYVLEYLTNRTPSSIAWIGSFQLMMPFALGIVSGKLFDNGYFHHVEIVGAVVFTISVFMLSLAKPLQYYQIFLSQGVGMGTGLGLTFVPTASIAVHYFNKRRGLASGVALSGSALGATVFPIMLNHMVPKHGFATSVRATGYIVIGCLVSGNALMRTRLPPRSQRPGATTPDIKSFFTDYAYLWSIFGLLISSIGFYFPVIYIQLYAVQHSVGSSLAFYSIAILNISSAFGRVSGNYLSDLYGSFNVMIVFTGFTGASIWAMLGIHNAATLVVISILYGYFSGAWLALALVAISSLARSADEVGARTGLALALSSVGSLVSAPIQGALLTSEFHWIRPVAFSGCVMFAGAVSFIVARTLQAKARCSNKV